MAIYQDEVSPYALDLTLKLSQTFFAYVSSSDEDDSDEAELAASGCLCTIKKILMAKLNQETYHKAVEILVPVFNYTLSEKGSTFLEEGLGCLNGILFNMLDISEKMWHYYLVLNYIIAGKPKNIPIENTLGTIPDEKALIYEQTESGWGPHYIEQMLGSLQNYISKGKGLLLQAKDPGFGVTYLELLFKSIERIYDRNKDAKDDIELTLVTTLFISIIESCVGLIDNIVPLIMEKCVILLNNNKKHKNFKKILTQTVAFLYESFGFNENLSRLLWEYGTIQS